MPNKYYSDVADYLVGGAVDKGYLKSKNGGYGDGTTSTPNDKYDSKQGVGFKTDGWFEGKKGNVGTTVKR